MKVERSMSGNWQCQYCADVFVFNLWAFLKLFISVCDPSCYVYSTPFLSNYFLYLLFPWFVHAYGWLSWIQEVEMEEIQSEQLYYRLWHCYVSAIRLLFYFISFFHHHSSFLLIQSTYLLLIQDEIKMWFYLPIFFQLRNNLSEYLRIGYCYLPKHLLS